MKVLLSFIQSLTKWNKSCMNIFVNNIFDLYNQTSWWALLQTLNLTISSGLFQECLCYGAWGRRWHHCFKVRLHTVSLSQVHAGPSWLRVPFSVLTLFRGICLKFGQIAKKDSGRDSCWVIDKKRGYKFDSGEVLFCMCCWPSNFTYTEVSYEYNTTGQCSWKGSCLCLSTIICHGEQQTAHIINNHQFLYCSRSHFGAVEVPLIHFL